MYCNSNNPLSCDTTVRKLYYLEKSKPCINVKWPYLCLDLVDIDIEIASNYWLNRKCYVYE